MRLAIPLLILMGFGLMLHQKLLGNSWFDWSQLHLHHEVLIAGAFILALGLVLAWVLGKLL